MKYGTFLHIARDVWRVLIPLIGMGAIGALVLDATWLVALTTLLVFLLALCGRDADRQVPPHPLGLLAPADGQVIHLRECHDPYLDRAAIRLSIAISPVGVYYLRAPTEGTLMELRSCRQCGSIDQASWIRTDEFDDVVLVVRRGSLLGQRPCDAGFGQRLGQGRRCGGRRLARVLDVYIPARCRVDVRLGDKVRAGTDVIATMVHNSSKHDTEHA